MADDLLGPDTGFGVTPRAASILDAVPPIDVSSPGSRGPEGGTEFGTAAAAGWQLSPLGATIRRIQEVAGLDQAPDPSFKLGDALRAANAVDLADSFHGIVNRQQFEARLASVRAQHQAQRDMAAAGPWGYAAGMAAGFAGDPFMLAGFAGGIRKIKAGYDITRGLAAVEVAAQFATGTEASGLAKRAVMADPPKWGDIHAEAFTNALLGGATKFTGSALGGAAVMGGYAAATNEPGAAEGQKVVNVTAGALMGMMIGSHTVEQMSPAERRTAEWALDKATTPIKDLKAEDFVPPAETYVSPDFRPEPPAAPAAPIRTSKGGTARIIVEEERPFDAKPAPAPAEPPARVVNTPRGAVEITLDEDLPFDAAPSAKGSLSSAASPFYTLDQLDVAGGLPKLINNVVGKVSPNGRAFQTYSTAAADAYHKLYDNSIRTRLADAGGSASPGGTVEGWRQQMEGRWLGEADPAHEAAYREMGRDGVNMRQADFDRAVGDRQRGVATPDIEIPAGAEPYIQKAADVWKAVTDKVGAEAVKVGLLKQEELLDGYLHRIYATKKMVAEQDGLYAAHTPYWQGALQNEYSVDRASARGRLAKLDDRIRMLELGPEERAAELSKLKDAAEKLDLENDASIRRLAEISDALKAGDKETAARLREEGGEELQNYVRQRAELRAARRTIGQGFAATAERLDRTMQRVVELEDRAFNDVNRVTKRAANLFEQIDRSSAELHAEALDRLNKDFVDLVARHEKATVDSERLKAETDRQVETAQEKRRAAEQKLADLDKQVAEQPEGGTPAQSEAAARMMREEIAAATVEADLLAKHAERMERFAKAQRERADRLDRMAERLDVMEALDPAAKADALKEALRAAVAETAKKVLSRGEEIAALKEKAATLSPERVAERVAAVKQQQQKVRDRFDEKWADASSHEARIDGEDVPSFFDEARGIVQDFFNTVTGRDVGASGVPHWRMAPSLERGPLKGRTYNVPEELLTPWLERDARYANARMIQKTAGAIAFAKRFPGETPKSIEEKIAQQFADLRETVIDAKNTATIAGIVRDPKVAEMPLAAARKEALQRLDRNEATAREDIRAGIEMQLGTYRIAENQGNLARALRAIRIFNFAVEGGGFLLAHLNFLARPMMVHGLKEVMDLVPKFARDMRAVEMLADEAKEAAVGLQLALHHTTMALSEIGNPYARGTAIERLLQSTASHVSKWSGLPLYLDTLSKADALITQQRILRHVGTDSAEGRSFLGGLDIDRNLAGRIAKEFATHGETTPDGLRIPNTEAWTDRAAAEAYHHAVWKQAGITIPQMSAGDAPLMANTPIGASFLQFNRFLMAQHQRILMRGLQEGPGRFIGGAVSMVAISMFIAYAKAAANGKQRFEKFSEEMAAEPIKLLYVGLDHSGILPYLFLGANVTQSLARGDLGERVLGPAAGTLSRVKPAALGVAAATGLTEKPMTTYQHNAIIHMLPGGSLPLVRQALQAAGGNAPWQ